ncbi:hypothetical protein [Mesorhizobium onobrychidis]|uniref:Uncharacterized protein n=1 Tax=Mesorhizobium onobrychidis TaxID=2775404 RepID=A0ABY5R960_9HYPH|nr:hypothetical protein [Mesorhizobium onobrychidis]UVC19329.1 hypothetical protein IHQ72_36100 [Mesorhizobium onobrychidis]
MITTPEEIAARFPIRSFGGFEIINIYPIHIRRTANGRNVPNGDNKSVLRGMASRLDMCLAGRREMVDPTGAEFTTHAYATAILQRLNAA